MGKNQNTNGSRTEPTLHVTNVYRKDTAPTSAPTGALKMQAEAASRGGSPKCAPNAAEQAHINYSTRKVRREAATSMPREFGDGRQGGWQR